MSVEEKAYNISMKGDRLVRVIVPAIWNKRLTDLFIEAVKGNIDDINRYQIINNKVI